MGSGAQATPTPYQEATSAATRPSDVTGTASPPDDTLLIMGGYTDIDLLAHTPCVKSQKISDGGDRVLDAGVHVLRVGGRDGALTHLSTNAIGPNVAFIARSPVNPDLLYASTERIDDEGEIITMRLTDQFRLVETSRARGGPIHVLPQLQPIQAVADGGELLGRQGLHRGAVHEDGRAFQLAAVHPHAARGGVRG